MAPDQDVPRTLTLALTDAEAESLCYNTSPNFAQEQPGRFHSHESGAAEAMLRAEWTLHWCETQSDALLFRAYQRAIGRTAVLLWDERAGDATPYVVLTSKVFSQP